MAKNWAFIFQMRMSTPGMPIDISTKFRVSSNFDFLTSKALNHFQGGTPGWSLRGLSFQGRSARVVRGPLGQRKGRPWPKKG
ncbi:unnamed protein product [Dovyalis caffra]|uniref:Uncharacterized protein n=1 Tax=Dovyalis caffra TaxID=77055 RepID=A0AAV1QNW3_9ROSI|nr:unnamed protein product [Dovyalis caffra]CAK7328673.1 unnamed protein product [Dovyalis caffra]